MYNVIDNLPETVKKELNELHPYSKTELNFFLKNTKEYHDLFFGLSKYSIFLNSNKISHKDYIFLTNNINKKNFKLKKAIYIDNKPYTKISINRPSKACLFFNPLGVYLTN